MNNLYKIAGKHRTIEANIRLGRILAVIAGFINAGGFFIVQQYTSHMTGIASLAADNVALGNYYEAFLMLFYVGCFVGGATATTVITLTSKKYMLHSQYAISLVFEALILLFLLALNLSEAGVHFLVVETIAMLCFLMGLQNALITKISLASIRTTHITGMSTDLGMEIGRIIFLEQNKEVNKQRAFLHFSMIFLFICGGIAGAFSFKILGVYAVLPPVAVLFFVSYKPIVRDIIFRIKHSKRKNRACSVSV